MSVKKTFIKEFGWHSDEKAYERVYALSEQIRKRGIKLPRAYVNTDAKFVELEFMDGEKFSGTDNELFSAGKNLALFHEAGKDLKISNQDIMPYEESRELYEKIKTDLKNHENCKFKSVCFSVMENLEVLDEVVGYIDQSGVNSPERICGILHNDFNIDNVLFGQDGEVSAIIDIDQASMGPLIWDISNSLVSFTWDRPKNSFVSNLEERAEAFLSGYKSVSKLPPEEYKLITAASLRWDMMRVLRSLRRHLYENDKFPDLIPKISDRFLPRILVTKKVFEL